MLHIIEEHRKNANRQNDQHRNDVQHDVLPAHELAAAAALLLKHLPSRALLRRVLREEFIAAEHDVMVLPATLLVSTSAAVIVVDRASKYGSTSGNGSCAVPMKFCESTGALARFRPVEPYLLARSTTITAALDRGGPRQQI